MGRHSSCYLEGRRPAAEPQGTVVKGKKSGTGKGREDNERLDRQTGDRRLTSWRPAAEPQGTVVKGKEDETGKGRTGGKGERAERETKGLNLGCYRFGHGV